MDDAFCEVLIKKKETGKEKGIRYGMLAVTAVLLAGGFLMYPILLVGALAMIIADYIVFPKLNVEYEYAYVNGELDIDRIFSKQSRKRAAVYNLENMELVAPVGSYRLDSYRNNQGFKKVDYTSGEEQDLRNCYAFVCAKEGTREFVLFQPNEKMIKDMRMRAPSKVFLN